MGLKIFSPTRRLWIFLFVLGLAGGCSKAKIANPSAESQLIQKLHETVAAGKYDEALKITKEITSHVPPSPDTEEALYTEGYIKAFGRSDFQAARLPLKQLLDLYPNGVFAPEAQKLLSDCQYWQGHYHNAGRDYKKLQDQYGEKDLGPYAQMQQANCLLLDDQVAEAITAYRDLVEKFPTDPMADSAQLMIANAYLKLQNTKQAKVELKKLMSFTRDPGLQQSTQKALRQIEEEEPFKKAVGVPE